MPLFPKIPPHTHNKIICNHKGIWMDFKGFLNPDRNCFLLSRNNGKRWAIRWSRFLASKVCTWQISRQDGDVGVKHDIKLMWLWRHLKKTTRNPQNIWRLDILCHLVVVFVCILFFKTWPEHLGSKNSFRCFGKEAKSSDTTGGVDDKTKDDCWTWQNWKSHGSKMVKTCYVISFVWGALVCKIAKGV